MRARHGERSPGRLGSPPHPPSSHARGRGGHETDDDHPPRGGQQVPSNTLDLVPTWLLAAYVLVVAITPATLALRERFGWWSILGGAALAGVDVVVSISTGSVLLFLGMFHIGLALLAESRLQGWLQRPAAWRATIAVCGGLAVMAKSGIVSGDGVHLVWPALPVAALLALGVVPLRPLVRRAWPGHGPGSGRLAEVMAPHPGMHRDRRGGAGVHRAGRAELADPQHDIADTQHLG